MAEYAVEFDNGGFEVLLEDIDDRIVGTTAQRIVVQLGGDAAADLIGTAVVAAAGALDAQFARREDRDGLIDARFEAGFEQDRAFENHVRPLLPGGPRIEIRHHDGMHQRIEVGERLRIAEDNACEAAPVELSVAEGVGSETFGEPHTQRVVLLHESFGRGVGIVNRNALLCKKAAYSALAAADAARYSDFHHGFSSG